MEQGDAFCEYCGGSASSGAQTVPSSQRMQLIILLDVSISSLSCMNQLTDGLSRFAADVGKDNKTRDLLDLVVIPYGERYSVIDGISNLTRANTIQPQPNGYACYSNAIREALRLTETYSRAHTHIHKPWIVMISTGAPVDSTSGVAAEVQSSQSAGKFRFIALGAVDSNAATLKAFTDIVIRQKGVDFSDFFGWLCNCVRVIVRTPPSEKPLLPNLDGNVYRDF